MMETPDDQEAARRSASEVGDRQSTGTRDDPPPVTTTDDSRPPGELDARRARLAEWSGAGEFYLPIDEHPGWLRCFACGHRCQIQPGREGICKVRTNRDGVLHVPRGYVSGLQCDPIEKKPFFHALPGCRTLSFGMLGCNLHCPYCQNWTTSQSLRDPAARIGAESIEPAELVALAIANDAPIITSTYNEPLITSEWAVEILQLGREQGLLGAFVSNGNATPEVLDRLRPFVDLYKVDLKCFDDQHYRSLGGRLQTVLETIEGLRERGFWVEVVTLLVTDFNDSTDELRSIARYLAGVDVDLPWHVTAFHADYKMSDRAGTATERLAAAYEIGHEAGLHHVYAGNRPGLVAGGEDTCCPSCDATLVRRAGFRLVENRLADGACPDCGTAIAGVWQRPEVTT